MSRPHRELARRRSLLLLLALTVPAAPPLSRAVRAQGLPAAPATSAAPPPPPPPPPLATPLPPLSPLSPPSSPSPPELAGPSLPELQRAALEVAGLDPGRIASLERRLRAASLLPQLRVRVGRGTGQLVTTTEYDGTARLTAGDRDAWQFDVSASWSLERMVYHPDELRLLRDAERLAVHREKLLREVAELWTERRRLRLALSRARMGAVSRGDGRGDGEELALRLAAVSATLDALTGGALGEERRLER